ncbi:MAG: hypothetical protein JWN72_2320, partial [Thermoleophilia bacterium]|nr:hypothetical protein [Thermoleophilia bacterium]
MAEFSVAIERDVDLGSGCRALFVTM